MIAFYQYIYLTDLAYAYLGLLIAFSIAQLFLLQQRNRVQIALWIGASFFSALGTAFAPHLLTVFSVKDFGVWGGLSALFGGVLRFLALSYGVRAFHRDRLAWLLLLLTLVGMPYAALPMLAEYRLLVSSFVGASISAACFMAMLRNRFWRSSSLFGLRMSLFGMGLSCVTLIMRGLTSYPFGSDQIFFGVSPLQQHAMELLVGISFFLQLGFTAMLVARRNQEDLYADRRAMRLTERTNRLRKRQQETAEISRARLDLVQLLTHEVRQPISNAQASLQSINYNLQAALFLSTKATKALGSAQSSLDAITLALSNVIVATTLVSQERRWEPQEFDANAILEMARQDCRFEDQCRIVSEIEEQHIYLIGVPILLRVALQNIFDYAVAFSNVQSKIFVQLLVEPDSEMALFRVRFKSSYSDLQTSDLFERRRSSDIKSRTGSSLGLFVVRQIAQSIHGQVSFSRVDQEEYEFCFYHPY